MSVEITVDFTTNSSIRIIYEVHLIGRRLVHEKQGIDQLKLMDEYGTVMPVSFEECYQAMRAVHLGTGKSFCLVSESAERVLVGLVARLGRAHDVITIVTRSLNSKRYVHIRDGNELIAINLVIKGKNTFLLLVDNLGLEESQEKIKEYLLSVS